MPTKAPFHGTPGTPVPPGSAWPCRPEVNTDQRSVVQASCTPRLRLALPTRGQYRPEVGGTGQLYPQALPGLADQRSIPTRGRWYRPPVPPGSAWPCRPEVNTDQRSVVQASCTPRLCLALPTRGQYRPEVGGTGQLYPQTLPGLADQRSIPTRGRWYRPAVPPDSAWPCRPEVGGQDSCTTVVRRLHRRAALTNHAPEKAIAGSFS